MKKFLMILLVLSLSASFVFSAGQEEKTDGGEDKPITLTYFTPLHKDAAQVMTSLNESYPYQVKEEMTGVKIEFIHPPVGAEQELAQYNLLIASGDLPDIMAMAERYKGGPDKAIADGVYLRLNELIDDYAPNYAGLRASNPEIAKQTITDEGNIYSFDMIQPIEEGSWLGAYIRGDLLEKAGLSVPETIEEWEVALRAFKDMGVDVPLLYKFDWTANAAGVFSGAFNSHSDFMQDEGNVVYGPIQPGYREFLTTMNRWYEEGLLDSEMATRDNKSSNALITSGEMGAFIAAYGQVASFVPALQANGFEDATIVPVPYPGANGQRATYKQKNFFNKGQNTAITTSCEYPEEAVKWMDFGYDEFGYLLHNYGGKEGETYTVESGNHEILSTGVPVLTDLILSNPDSPYQFAKWLLKTHHGPYLRDFRASPRSGIVADSMKVWGESSDGEGVLPRIVMNDEESRKVGTIMGDIETYVKEMRLKFVMGIEPMENFDAYVEQIENMRIDEAVAAKQAALDRYLSR